MEVIHTWRKMTPCGRSGWSSGQRTGMTRKRWNILIAASIVLVIAVPPLYMVLPWVLFPLKDYKPLLYPDGVSFRQKSNGQFTSARWFADDWDRPGLCP